MNRDNRADLILLTQTQLSLKWGEAFNGGLTYTVPYSLAFTIADFTQDGWPDLLLAGENLTLLRNDRQGGFIVSVLQNLNLSNAGSVTVVAGDFTGDGLQDLALASSLSNTLDIWANQGNFTFQKTASLPVGFSPHALTSVDFNQDGKSDLVFANRAEKTVTVWLQQANTQFAPQPSIALTDTPEALQFGDFDRDGKADLVVALRKGKLTELSAAGAVTIMQGQGNGSFVRGPTLDFRFVPYHLFVADFNGDQRLDLALGHGNLSATPADRINVLLLGLGTGRFAAPLRLNEMQLGYLLVAADLNADGKTDMVTSESGNTFPVLLNVTDCGTLTNTPPRSTQTEFTPLSLLRNAGPRGVYILATLSDVETAPSDLQVELESAPAGVTAEYYNVAGTVGVTLSATCAATPGTHRICYRVTDSGALSVVSEVTIQVLSGDPVMNGFSELTASLQGFVVQDLNSTATEFQVNVSSGFTGVATIRSSTNTLFITRAGPVGRHVVTVTANGPCGQRESRQFALIVTATSGCTLPTFESSATTTFYNGLPFNDSGWHSTVPGDFDGDGHLDWLGAPRTATRFRWMRGNATGGIGTMRQQPLGTEAQAPEPLPQLFVDGIEWMLAADFDSDGKSEALMVTQSGAVSFWRYRLGVFERQQTWQINKATSASLPHEIRDVNADALPDLVFIAEQSVVVMYGNANGSLDSPRYTPIAEPFNSIAMADFNQDGKLDLVTNGAMLKLWLGKSDGTFEASVSVGTDPDASLLVSGDLNRDGLPDLLFYDLPKKQLGVLRAEGQGFRARQIIQAGPLSSDTFQVLPQQPLLADFNRDGNIDLAIANRLMLGATILPGDGQGGFSAARTFGIYKIPSQLFARDLNRDGYLDLAVPFQNANGMAILFGDGSANFAAQRTSPIPNASVNSLAAGDFNGDGRQDVLTFQTNESPRSGIVTVHSMGATQALEQKASLNISADVNLIVADFNRDGRSDILTLSQTNIGQLFLNNLGSDWSSAFQPPISFSLPFGGLMRAADFNGDGYLDCAITNTGIGKVVVAFNQGGQGFSAALSYTLPVTGSYEIGSADLNRDSKADLVVMQPGRAVILRGDGFGFFARMSDVSTTGQNLHIADLNRDGNLDLLFFKSETRQLVFCQGNGEGSFGLFMLNEPVTDPNTYVFVPTTISDVNGDGNLDLIDANSEPLVALGDGRGGFQPPYYVLLFGTDQKLIVDVTGDGLPDIVAIKQETFLGSSIEVFPNIARCQPPRNVSSVSAASYRPNSHAPDMIAAVFGERLATSAQAAADVLTTQLVGTSVTIRDSGGVEHQARLFSVSPTQVNFLVPSSAALGAATVNLTSGVGEVSRGNIDLAAVAPGLFTVDANGKGLAAGLALRLKNGVANYAPLVTYDRTRQQFVGLPIDVQVAGEQVFLVLFGTGLRHRSALSSVSATIGGRAAALTFAGAQGALLGLDQINIALPATLAGLGSAEVLLNVDGQAANSVQIIVK